MNLTQSVQRRFSPVPVNEVDQICAAVPKGDELIAAERALAETLSQIAKSTKRQQVIQERLIVRNPTTTPMPTSEQQSIEVENRKLTGRVISLQGEARKLKAEIDRLMPTYVQEVASALAPFRKRAAKQLDDGIGAMETALKDIDASNQTLRGLGRSTPSVMAMPMASAYRTLAAKVAREGRG